MKTGSDILVSNLSQSQLLIWTGQEFNPGTPLYNMLLTFEIRGPVEVEYFIRAFEGLVKQSDAMRTVFYLDHGVPRQRVTDEIYQPLKYHDWSMKPEKEALLQNWITDHAGLNFDLTKCAFESALIRMSYDRYIWYLNQHHLITDAWSVSIQYKALAENYVKSKNGETSSYDKLPQFDGYLKYQRENRENPLYQSAREYWKHKLMHIPPITRLYGFNHQIASTASERITINLGPDRSGMLRQLAAEPDFRAWTEHLSLYNIFATILFAFLYRISGQSRLSVGSPAHNRLNLTFKNTPGLFMELFPVFVEVESDTGFHDLFSRVRNQTNDFLRNALPGTTSPEANKCFQVVLNYIHASFQDFDSMPMDSQWVHPGHCDPGHHLRLQVHDFDSTGNIQLHFDLNTQVFSRSSRTLVPGHFLNLLDAFLEDQTQLISKSPLVSDSEYQHLRTAGLGSKVSWPAGTVVDLFKVAVEKYPDQQAVLFGDSSISYRQLDQESNQLAHYLCEQNIGRGKSVVLYLNRSVDLLVSIWAVLKSGAAYVPLDINFPEDRVNYIIDDLNASAIIISGTKSITTGVIPQIVMDSGRSLWSTLSKLPPPVQIGGDNLAYIIYTSGTTGSPKGVMVSHGSLVNYILWARDNYVGDQRFTFPWFTTPAFDLTVTSIFVPLISGGKLCIYPEPENGPDVAFLKVIEENRVDILKLTPSHLGLLSRHTAAGSKIQKMILGGEDLKTSQVSRLKSILGPVEVYNEYGPTEATVGCIVQRIKPNDLQLPSIPIGRPISNMTVYLLDEKLNPVPQGVAGEIYLAGAGISEGYWNRPAETAEKFVDCPFPESARMYRTGDLGRWNQEFDLEYLGRKDRQLKIRGVRVEPGEIEATLSAHPGIRDVVVELHRYYPLNPDQLVHCKRCGLPSNYPSVQFDELGICHLCRSFEQYQDKAKRYFKQEQELVDLINSAKGRKSGVYDCLMLLSGGKDSTYALARLVDMGFRVLAFTLDNGYISDQAKSNIRRVTGSLPVDHVFGKTEAMNEIFVDSLKRHCNVCNGCFKTIYTLSTNLAVEKGIPVIVTGLSRGQFFETRLTGELFMDDKVDFDSIDQTILQARKAYHHTDDAVKRLLDVSIFRDHKVFEMIQYVDFYRYSDVSLDEMLKYLDQHLPWIRPTDTGRSTNCLINQVGIYEHKRKRGYSNYAFPYSWDVRMGHKTRDASIREINEEIDEDKVLRIMQEIGYQSEQNDPETLQLVAYYTGSSPLPENVLRQYLSHKLPENMVPSQFQWLEALPMTPNGKVDYNALPGLSRERPLERTAYKAPESQVEQMLAQIWSEVLQIPEVGVDHNFIHIGGNSLTAIRLISRINHRFHLDLPLSTIFESPTIARFGELIDRTIAKLLHSNGPLPH